MRVIGRVINLQVQKASLKRTRSDQRYYDPDPLVSVQSIILDSNGAIGIAKNGEQILDIHNQNHPQSRNRGDNALSIGFSSHYKLMQLRFGDHLAEGIAGENMLISSDSQILPHEIQHLLALQNSSGEIIHLKNVVPAPPCLEFTHFAARKPLHSHEIRDNLQFLGNGMRGYYLQLDRSVSQVTVSQGDKLIIL